MWTRKPTRKVNTERFFQLKDYLPPKKNVEPQFLKIMPALKQKEKKEKSSEKVVDKKTLNEPLEILSYNKFACLYPDEDTEDENCNGSLDTDSTKFDQEWKKSRAKPPKKCVKEKKKIPAMNNSTIKSSFEPNGSPEAFRCHICNKLQSMLKGINDKKKKFIAEKKIGLKDLDMLLYCIVFLESKYATSSFTLESNAETKSHTTEIVRLRGGAGNSGSSKSTIIKRAIESARKHGINLEQGKLNKADGNCAFDAVLYNINHRECFQDKLQLDSEVYRQIWVTELESESSKYPRLGAGYSEEERKRNWNLLKQSGVYEVDFFGDYVMNAIAKGCHKNILIFNTSVVAADPIYVIRAAEFNGFTDCEIPVVVGYDQTHYESLHPSTEADILKTIDLVNSYTAGTYGYTKKDLPILLSLTDKVDKNNYENEFPLLQPAVTKRKSELKRTSKDKEFPKTHMKKTSLSAKQENGNVDKKSFTTLSKSDYLSKSNGSSKEKEDNCFLNLEFLRKIKVENRTPEQKKQYNKLMKEKSRTKQTKSEKDAIKMKETKLKKKSRSDMTEVEKDPIKMKETKLKKKSRSDMTEVQKKVYHNKDKEAKQKLRSEMTEDENKTINKKKKDAMQTSRKKPRSAYDARNAQDVLYGKQIVKELKFTDDSIGKMDSVCDKCSAKKWKTETNSTCCNNGSVILDRFPDPPPALKTLWKSNSPEARLFRENSRVFNNGLALASLKVNERKFRGSSYAPSVVFEGKVQIIQGPLMAEQNEQPRFAQIYVHDPATQHTVRINNMNLPESLSTKQRKTLSNTMKKLQDLMMEVNPFVKDFLHIAEIPDEDIKEGKLVISCRARPNGEHERRYNEQQSLSEVSVLTNSESGDLVLRKRGGGLQTISDLNPSAQPLHFTLLFPYGTKGYNEADKKKAKDGSNSNRRVTPREFFAFHLNMRDYYSDFLFRGGRLFQEYLCIAFATMESQRLKFIKFNQKSLRADSYKNIKEVLDERVPMTDKILPGDDTLKFGRKVILPSSFVGSPRWYNNQFQDAMAICREYHKPDFFITMTCNPKWTEITDELREGENVGDRPDLVARVFKQKKDQLMKYIRTGNVFGKVPAFLWVIEFQKRGLPHIHILVILSDDDCVSCTSDVDNVIWAQLPPSPDSFADSSPERDQAERLEAIVLANMVHGPCGKEFPESPCMRDGKCAKGYPKKFCDRTVLDPDNMYPEYQRLAPEKGGRCLVMKKGKEYVLDNQWIVPFSPFLSLIFDCHINIELCMSPTAAKYLYKYVFKGEDRAMVSVEVRDDNIERNEVEEYEDLRSIGSSEAAWHIFNFNIAKKYPAVYALRCHLEDEQQVLFDDETDQEIIEKQRNTELTEFFVYNKEHTDTDSKYVDFPKFFTWNKTTKKWSIRKGCFDTIGRVHAMNPLAGDVFYLRMILHHDHCKGKKSFEDLRSVDGTLLETYQEVCRVLGLLQDDKEWEEVLSEGAATKMSYALRELFVIILIFCYPANPVELFNKYHLDWADDFKKDAEKKQISLNERQLRTLVTLDIQQRLQSWDKDLKTFRLQNPTQEELDEISFDHTNVQPVVIREELDFDVSEMLKISETRMNMFTDEQQDIFNTVMEAVKNDIALAMFIDARGGTGKTFVLNAILAAVRCLDPEKGGSIALATATTGIAANLLLLGRTFHSRFKADLSPHVESMCNIDARSTLADLIRKAKVIIVDECSMQHRYHTEALDRTLRDITCQDEPFGGKILILSGDFRQCLPVIPGASRGIIVDAALNRSPLWAKFIVKRLTKNMRILSSGEPSLIDFDEWTVKVGDGLVENIGQSDVIEIPDEMCITIEENCKQKPDAEKDSMKLLANKVYPNLANNHCRPSWMDGRAILAPTNKKVDAINNLISDSFPGHPVVLTSSDEVINPQDLQRYNTEYLNTLTPSGMPSHRLFLKSGMPLMLLRNLNPKMGLCNGTRLIFHKVHKNYLLECSIVGGEFNNRKVLIPRITTRPKDREFPFEWSRRQFPVRVAFAMTINKSQGQTLLNVGVWLSDTCFSHGQLYVAVSRVGSPSSITLAIRPIDDKPVNSTSNVVYKEVFNKLI